MANNKPIHTIRSGAVKAAIWANHHNGQTFHSFTLSRLYRADESWKSTSSFSRFDFNNLLAITVAVDEWIRNEERAAGEKRRREIESSGDHPPE